MRLGLSLREVQRRSLKIVEDRGNPEFHVSRAWLSARFTDLLSRRLRNSTASNPRISVRSGLFSGHPELNFSALQTRAVETRKD